MVVVDAYSQIFRSEAGNLNLADDLKKLQICSHASDSARAFTFESFGGGHYRVESAGKYLTLLDDGYTIAFTDEVL